jgi:3-oxoacyl-[acyl-carrier protein] reductase
MFKNKTILITGASSGIGEVTALMFAKEGANIVFTYKSNKEGADNVLAKIQELGQGALAIQADLGNENEAHEVIEKTMKEFGSIDILVNNAGRYIDGDEWKGSSDIWIKSLQQNLVSAMNVSKYVLEVFLKQQNGVMVNVASRYSTDGQFDALAYSASKAALVNITESYSKLLKPFGRANAISPGAVKVGYWLRAPQEELEAQGKLIEPEDVAKKILFLASDESKDVTGQNFPILA